ncbi:MAG TPA: exodeoxyribonuclease VII small subunit [Anaerolineaceae bacterium]|nr:exodeoxyribonuclease VII small subunit [Anaerolineaceae bacterium]HPN52311.1 exodeoxyribonuclease VII small subunit [Anaerolineaceae bacterium]
MQADPNDIQEMTYETAFGELQGIVRALESGQRPLDEAIRLFERGQALALRCTSLLDEAELKLRRVGGEAIASASTQS